MSIARPGLQSIRMPLTTTALVAAALLSACGPTTKTSSSWQEPRTVNAPFGHVLVVAASPNSRLRRGFEIALVDLIKAGGSQASASVQVGNPTDPLTAESVGDMVQKSGADAVLVARVIDREVELAKSRDRLGVKLSQPDSISQGTGTFTDYFRTEYSVYQTPGEVELKSMAKLDSSLYDVRNGGKVVYEVTTTTNFKEGEDDVVGEVTSALAKQLKRDGLVK